MKKRENHRNSKSLHFWGVQMLIFQRVYMWFYDSMIFCDQFHVANRRIWSSTIGDVEVVETSQRSGSRTLELLRSLDWWRRIGVDTLLQTNISHLWKRNIIDSQLPLKGICDRSLRGYLVDIFSESIKDYLVFRCFANSIPSSGLILWTRNPEGIKKKGVKEQKNAAPPNLCCSVFW